MKIKTFAMFVVVLCLTSIAIADPLPSWRDSATKNAIMSFVDAVTDPSSDGFVPVSERIAVFDNDGTLWAEGPYYFQVFFAMDIIASRAAVDPSILTSDAIRSAAKGDLVAVLEHGVEGLLEVVDASHSGVSVAEFQIQVRDWLYAANHPSVGRTYAEMTYQPMLELLSYLRDSGFMTYIVSGGGVDFIRAFAEDAYGIPPYQVVGSIGNHSYIVEDGEPAVQKDPGIFFVDDKAGKPIAISRQIGMRPIFAAGNSDGDFEMLEWTTAGDGLRFGMLVHHTDTDREWAYDRESHFGKLDRGLDEGPGRGWTIVDMKRDWQKVFPDVQESN